MIALLAFVDSLVGAHYLTAGVYRLYLIGTMVCAELKLARPLKLYFSKISFSLHHGRVCGPHITCSSYLADQRPKR